MIKKMANEFKEFINRGSVLDLAIGVIIGGATTNIVSSLAKDILTPIIGIFLGGVKVDGLKLTINDAVIAYGAFLQNVLDFIITAFCVFIVMKIANVMFKKKEVVKKEEKPKPSKEEELLTEIRDLLKNKE